MPRLQLVQLLNIISQRDELTEAQGTGGCIVYIVMDVVTLISYVVW